MMQVEALLHSIVPDHHRTERALLRCIGLRHVIAGPRSYDRIRAINLHTNPMIPGGITIWCVAKKILSVKFRANS